MSEECTIKDHCIKDVVDHTINNVKEDVDKKKSVDPNSQILKIVSEMVEITCTNLSEDCLKLKVDPPEIFIVCEDFVKQKTEGFVKEIYENELPVRRSNRIRKTVVKKDEFISPRSNKKARNQKNSEISSLKSSETETKKSLPSDNKTSQSNKEVPRIKSDAKISKIDKANRKVSQNTKQPVQNEKKITSRKRKSQKEVSTNNTSGSIGSKCKSNNKTTTFESEFVALTSTKVSDSFSNSESESHSSTKVSDDPNCEANDKSFESCNIKPVKVKSRWWRSSELEAVMNSETINSDNLITLTKSEPVELPPENANQVAESKMETVELFPIDDVKIIDVPKCETGELLPVTDVKMTSLKIDCIDLSTEKDNREEQVCHDMNVGNEKSMPNIPPDSLLPQYDHIEENIYRFSRRKCKSKKQVRRMVCDCTLTKEELEYGVMGCKEECLNRLLMIECGSRCPIGEFCSNKKFQKKENAKVETFKTQKKGWGLRTLEHVSVSDFLMEFVGEVLNHKEYRQRVKQYAKEKNVHCYFMALKTDEILDATSKGNFSRFINHSCDPNCETQKWTVNGELRVGVFAKKSLSIGEELTLDYKFQRYGREAQKCHCGAENCLGFIGGAKQISIDAYSGNKTLTSRSKRKGSEDKKRDLEDMILEEEIEKLNGNRGLRNREDTLKLARLMVRADDSATRQQLMDIILKTEEQACLRLFLDYHGLPLLWSWMTDIVEFNLKTKILQVLCLLPVSNKTMLLDSKVMNIVEKWQIECSSSSDVKNKVCSEKSLASSSDDNTDLTKKLKLTDLSDSETDSTSSHTIMEICNELSSATSDSLSKICLPADSANPSETLKENTCEGKELHSSSEDPDSSLKSNIVNLASGLLYTWKNLKEVFRIPRLEQQKRKEDEMEVDNNAKEKVKKEISESSSFRGRSTQRGDQIQVVISGNSGKNALNDHHRVYDYEQPDMKLEDCPRRLSETRPPPVLATPRQISSKPSWQHPYPKITDKGARKHKIKEDISKCSPDIRSPGVPPGPLRLPPPSHKYPEQPPISYPPSANLPVSLHHPVENPSPLLYPPQMIYSQSQMPFMGSTPPILPHNTGPLPPPSSVTSQPPLIQQPPINAGLPPCQPMVPTQSNVGVPPSANNFLLPPSVPPSSVVPGTSQYIPSQPPPVQNFPPANNVYNNQNQQPMYFLPQQPGLTNNPPPTFTENVPVQQSASTFTVQPIIPVAKEETKPVKLPKNWRTATDPEGNIYYYHSITRQTQWDPPEEESEDEDSSSEESESSDTPTYDEPKVISTKHSRKKSKRRKPTKAAADTSVVPIRPEIAKKIKELFRTKMSSFIVHCLNAYRKPDCMVGRITSNDDFKYLARKLTHYTMTKELKQCKNVEDLDCNETVMHKAKDFIKKYMAKYGAQYSRKEKYSPPEH